MNETKSYQVAKMAKLCKEIYKEEQNNCINITEMLKVNGRLEKHLSFMKLSLLKANLLISLSLSLSLCLSEIVNQYWHTVKRSNLVANQNE